MRPNQIAIGLLAATVGLGLYALWPRAEAPETVSATGRPALMSGERPIPPPPPGVSVRPPQFDLLRIEPDGAGVAQGHAEALARVWLRAETGTDLGSGQADGRGEWVILIRRPLAPGNHVLALLAEMPDGTGVPSTQEAVVALPERPAGRPLVVLTAPDEPSRVLQSPQGPHTQALSLEAVDAEPNGALRLSGRAEPGRNLYLYADNRYLAQTVVDDEGRWTHALAPGAIGPGAHRLRFDLLGESGDVARRLEAGFAGTANGKDRPRAEAGSAPVTVTAEGQGWRIVRSQGRMAARQTLVYGEDAGTRLDPAARLPGQVPVAEKAIPPAGLMPAADR